MSQSTDLDRPSPRRAALDLGADTFRHLGHQLVDAIADRLARVPSGPVTPGETPTAVRAAIDAERPLPEGGGDAATVLSNATRLLFEHSLFNGHPRFFGYITSSPAPIGMLADLLASAVNPNVGAWALSPVATEIEAQADSMQVASVNEGVRPQFWTRDLRRPIALAFLVAFFNQLSGVNAILYFAPRIFELTGLAAKAALLQSVGIGVTNLIFTLAGVWLIDRVGRRTLLYVGSFGYIASLGLTAWAFFTEHYAIVPPCIFAFIAAHAIGQGTVIWVFISEVFPNRFRAAGQALGSGTHWVFAALLTTFFPGMVTAFAPGYVFLFFCEIGRAHV